VAVPRLGLLDRESVVNVQGLGSIPSVRFERRLGKLPPDAMAKVGATLAFALDLES
jgi:mRNA interferase MazF